MTGWVIAGAVVVGLFGNYFIFGPIGALIMVPIEFTIGLFVTLIFVLTGRRRR
jgi:hypothetical protein